MDVLRKELNDFYAGQELEKETLDPAILGDCINQIRAVTAIDNDCRVITDASADRCYIVGGNLTGLIGISDDGLDTVDLAANSSDEDIIYNRIHPEDLVEKRMLEYHFFKYVDNLPDNRKLHYKATCRLRMRNRTGEYVCIDNSTRAIRLSPRGKIWLILCCYNLSSYRQEGPGISPRIIDMTSGKISDISLSGQRSTILSPREKEILNLIKDGKLSKEIADILDISVNTVNRHRQNILEKLCVDNSMEAVMAAVSMRLL